MIETRWIEFYTTVLAIQFCSIDITGTSIMCTGNNLLFKDEHQLVPNMAIYHENIILIENATIIAYKRIIIHKENEMALPHCTAEQGTCETEDSTDIWNPKLQICNLKSTKIYQEKSLSLKNSNILSVINLWYTCN